MSITIPEIFRNCSHEYRLKDIKYVQCHIPMGTNPCRLLKYASAAAFILIGSLSFLTSAGTYVAVTTLLYLAIVHPLRYLYTVNVTRCFLLVTILWLVSIAFSLFLGLYGATLFYPETAPIYCSIDRCQQPIAVFVAFLLSAFFITVIISYLIMLYIIHSRDRDSRLETDLIARNNIRTMNRLALHMITFTVGSLPILVVIGIATINLKNFAVLGLGDKSSCKTFLHGRLFLQVEILACIAAIVWVLAMIFDPVINFLADPKLVDSMRPWRIRQQQIPCIEFQKPNTTATASI
ncbi:unnamed protein product [Acanthocheilonema viteae]|uniref:G-protein coupled receptors family 1 profile domain-containing protein n=1 Tax=Acanthocheilonema viteae TaxID=6277 RepID=A0A498S683_ACAVI|nr:unnamed protein product [Acanthocheilonema viteae]